MFPPPHPVARLSAGFLAIASVVQAEVLFENNFDQMVTDHIGVGQYSEIIPWEGPSRMGYGWVGVGGELSAIMLYDKGAAANQSATLQFSWKNKAPTSGKLVATWDFAIPAYGEYLATQFIGGKGWDDSALVLIFKDEGLFVHCDEGNESQANVGYYIPKKWHSISLNMDITAKTFDLFLDGKQVINDYRWLRKAATKLDKITTAADAAPVDRQGEAVLSIDNVSIVTTP